MVVSYSECWNHLFAALFASWLAITFLFYSLLSFTSSASNGLIINSSRPEVTTAHRGVVAADDGQCSRIGRDVLQEGGHAVDASVAVALCLGVVSPASSGIGGGAFMLLRLANGTTEAFDMRDTAPMKASKPKGEEVDEKKDELSRALMIFGFEL